MSLRIVGVQVFHLNAPLAIPFRWATGVARERDAILVKIETDDGIVGWGEALAHPAMRVIADLLSPLLVGKDALDHEVLVTLIRAAVAVSVEHRGVCFAAAGACEIALWDIAARAEAKPLHKLLGETQRQRVAVYASGLYYPADESQPDFLAEAENYLARGFTRVKMKIGALPIEDDLKRIGAVRALLGPHNSLMVDANQVYDVRAAARFSDGLKNLDVDWIEEPLPADDVDGYRRLSLHTSIPLAAGENLHGRADFDTFIDEGLLKVVQPNVGNVGGLREAHAVAHAANAKGLRVALHCWGTPVALAASLHLAACLPAAEEAPLVELDCTPNPLREILREPWTESHDGTLAVPEGPGLGFRPDEQAMMRFCKSSRRCEAR